MLFPRRVGTPHETQVYCLIVLMVVVEVHQNEEHRMVVLCDSVVHQE